MSHPDGVYYEKILQELDSRAFLKRPPSANTKHVNASHSEEDEDP